MFGGANQDWSDSQLFQSDGSFLEQAFSQHSWESGRDSSSPGNSYKDPFYGNQYITPAVGASSVAAPHMSFDDARYTGGFVQDHFKLQRELDDQDLYMSPQQMMVGSPAVDTGTWSAGGTSAPNSYTSHPVHAGSSRFARTRSRHKPLMC